MSLTLPASSSMTYSFCSKPCLLASKAQSHSLLFTLESLLPPDAPQISPPPIALEERRVAQAKFAEYMRKEGRAGPLLVARFVGRQLAAEVSKMFPSSGSPISASPKNNAKNDDFADADAGDYLLSDHIEPLRYLELEPSQEEHSLILNVLNTAMPGLEQFLTDERHKILLGKMAYNCFGVCFGGGRDDKVFFLCLRSKAFEVLKYSLLSPFPRSAPKNSREHARHTAPPAKSALRSILSPPISRTRASPLRGRASLPGPHNCTSLPRGT